ncbi:glycosyltransferase involved in cell wall biosynthesis [Spinactinospora alkalitolerans]|uniref:Glycosyltransferase involved in cell wall biosynthesis n=1 Tax=Spinactinospora alkalitolerans TaxID=687207 RepID=A0A852U2G4_9ACTN|nr:glycosyltransferase family 4 protein [Spinactinospora alkalitolerans]NYE49787.1 glycosyltransferase involved in cell wall biosynthesis [Spinactinospora alkalitolerans]
MKITFLIGNVYGMGGTIRTTTNLANNLVKRHDVEIVSMAQNAHEPFFQISPEVRLRSLAHNRSWADRPDPGPRARELELQPSGNVPASENNLHSFFNAHSDAVLRDYLSKLDSDVVIATRPGLNSLLAQWGPKKAVCIGQEHLNLGQQPDDVKEHIRAHHTRLDGLTVLTDSDRRDYTDFLGKDGGWVTTMPNPLPDGFHARSRLTNPIIATAGRLIWVKQYPKLVEAFASVADKHPEWQLRIYGRGIERAGIRAAVDRLGLNNNVVLMGRNPDITSEFAKASVVAVSSRQEGFGMTILESFAASVPVVSFDCPYGPRELITHGHDGLLVADQDVDALAAGLLRLVEDADERRRLGGNARDKAAAFHIDSVTERWEAYLSRLVAEKRRAGGLRRFLPWS